MASVHRMERQKPQGGARSEPVVIPFERPTRADSSPLILAKLIEGEIIPRLLLAHQSAPIPTPNIIRLASFTAVEVADFSAAAVAEDLGALLARIEGFLDRGVTVEQVYLDLLSPAAKLLGMRWEEDLSSFTDVTVGLCRLQQVVYDLAGRTPAQPRSDRREALFALTPGDQHAFGLVVVAEFFRRAGWRTVTAPDASATELVALVRSQSFDLVGFSMSDAQWLPGLPGLIARLRSASCNPNLRVIVGGQVFLDDPARVAQVGADATAEDARTAVESAEAFVGSDSAVA